MSAILRRDSSGWARLSNSTMRDQSPRGRALRAAWRELHRATHPRRRGDTRTVPRTDLRDAEARFLAAVEGCAPRRVDYLAFRLLARTGARIGELCALRLDNVDLQARLLDRDVGSPLKR